MTSVHYVFNGPFVCFQGKTDYTYYLGQGLITGDNYSKKRKKPLHRRTYLSSPIRIMGKRVDHYRNVIDDQTYFVPK